MKGIDQGAAKSVVARFAAGRKLLQLVAPLMVVPKCGAENQLKFSEAGKKSPKLKTSRHNHPHDFLWAQPLKTPSWGLSGPLRAPGRAFAAGEVNRNQIETTSTPNRNQIRPQRPGP